MLGCVSRKPSNRLHELALASWLVAVVRMVPGDRYMDEALQEVPFGRGRLAPFVLEFLVCLEELSRPDQFEASFERHHPIIGVRAGC